MSIQNNQELNKEEKPTNVNDLKCFEILNLFSLVLKNCEFVSIDVKNSMLDLAMQSWGKLTLHFLALSEKSFDDKDLSELAKQYSINKEGKLTENEKKEIETLIKIMVPLLVQTVMKESLGTDKIEEMLKNHLKENKPFIIRLLATFLCVDLSFSKFPKLLNELYESSPKSEYLSKLFYGKAISKLVTSVDLSEKNKKELVDFIIDIYVNDILKEKSLKKRNVLRNRLIKEIGLKRIKGKSSQISI